MIVDEIYKEDIEKIVELQYPWEKLDDHSILVTGATGLIGSLLVDVLIALRKKGHNFKLYALARNKKTLTKLFSYYNDDNFILLTKDINEDKLDIDCDIIIDCASNSNPYLYHNDPIGTIMTNVLGLNNLLDLYVRNKSKKFIFLSSVEIYGESRGDTDGFDEKYIGYIDCNTCRAGYNESKRVGEALCQAYLSKHDVNFNTVRLSRCYGPSIKLDDSKALSQFLFNGIKNGKIILKSNGNQLFSYCYSADAVSSIFFILFFGKKGEVYNVKSNQSDIKLKDLVKMISTITNSDIVVDQNIKENNSYSTSTFAVLNIDKISSLGWVPSYDLEDGIKRTIISLKKITE